MYYVMSAFLWALLSLPGLSAAEHQSQQLPAAPPTVALTAPQRDNPDQDSVYFQYGFEDDWSGWTSEDLTDVGSMWHPSGEHAFEGRSWWCADEETGGYGNHWMQHLMTPVFDLRGRQNLRLRFMVFWSVENPELSPPDPPYDGWDGCNLWISTDGGDEWAVLEPSEPAYNYRSLYSFGYEWGMGPDIPGWCASSGEQEWPVGEWVDAEFNLDDYAVNDVCIRWSFCSDPAWATGDESDPNRQAIGFLVDNMEITSGEDVVWSNDGEEQGNMEVADEQGEPSGDFWELTDEDSHEGDFSAHCPVEPVLRNALVTPAIEVPGPEYYTYFEFYVRCDARMADPENDIGLNDYFRVSVSEDSLNWTLMVYDYAAEDHYQEWFFDFGYYGPGTFWKRDEEWAGDNDWKWRLNLNPFAGETIWLRWEFVTDDVMDPPQGSGLYIDDFRIMISSRTQNDAGVDWLNIPYPTGIGFPTQCRIKVKNYGVVNQGIIHKYYRIDDGDPAAINPPNGLDSDSSAVYPFYLMGIPYADSVTVTAYTRLQGVDQNPANDAVTIDGVVIYPPGIYRLGYDQRAYQYTFNIDRGHGAAVRFTPGDDGYGQNFDLEALRVRWNYDGDDAVDCELHIFEDDDGAPGDEIYGETVTVTREDVLPQVQVIDLSGVNEVKDMRHDFWVWFEILRDDNRPRIIGNRPDVVLTEGHYYNYDGELLDEMSGLDFQVHAIIMRAETAGTELVAGRQQMDFGHIAPGWERELRLALFNGGVTPVTIEGVEVDNAAFDLYPNFETPYTLRIGDMAHIYVVFAPQEEMEYSGQITFQTDDEEPPVVPLLGVGDPNAGVKDREPLPAEFAVGDAYPNPFNATTVIPYDLPHRASVELAVYDLSGRRMATLVSGQKPAGRYNATFDGSRLGSGVYIYRFAADETVRTGKMVLVK